MSINIKVSIQINIDVYISIRSDYLGHWCERLYCLKGF